MSVSYKCPSWATILHGVAFVLHLVVRSCFEGFKEDFAGGEGRDAVLYMVWSKASIL